MSQFNLQKIGGVTVVEFTTASLMDRIDLEKLGQDLYKLVDEQDLRNIIIDFHVVQYLSSQAIGILLSLRKKMVALKGSHLVMCGVGPRLMELLKITRLDVVFTVKADQKDALRWMERQGAK